METKEKKKDSVTFVPSYIWDLRFLDLARLISFWSKDPSTKVGVLAVGFRRRILAQAYNGFPSGANDSEERYNNRELKYDMIIHGEKNLIYNASRIGVSLEGSVVYVYGMFPCPECVKGLAQVGVVRIVFMVGFSKNTPVWEEKFGLSKAIMKELGIAHTQFGYKEAVWKELQEDDLQIESHERLDEE